MAGSRQHARVVIGTESSARKNYFFRQTTSHLSCANCFKKRFGEWKFCTALAEFFLVIIILIIIINITITVINIMLS